MPCTPLHPELLPISRLRAAGGRRTQLLSRAEGTGVCGAGGAVRGAGEGSSGAALRRQVGRASGQAPGRALAPVILHLLEEHFVHTT